MHSQKNKYSNMKNKANRLDAIKAIVSSSRIDGQEELLEQLRRKGFELTQATLSRDLKSLQIVKIAHQSGGYQYVLPEAVSLVSRKQTAGNTTPLTAANGFFSIAFSGQIAPGLCRRNGFRDRLSRFSRISRLRSRRRHGAARPARRGVARKSALRPAHNHSEYCIIISFFS